MLDVMARPKHDGAESGHQLPLDDGAYDSNDNMCDICCDFRAVLIGGFYYILGTGTICCNFAI